MKTEFKIVKCECCKKDIKAMGNQKYCNNCGKYVADLKAKVCHYKQRFEKVNFKLYGNINGAKRSQKIKKLKNQEVGK